MSTSQIAIVRSITVRSQSRRRSGRAIDLAQSASAAAYVPACEQLPQLANCEPAPSAAALLVLQRPPHAPMHAAERKPLASVSAAIIRRSWPPQEAPLDQASLQLGAELGKIPAWLTSQLQRPWRSLSLSAKPSHPCSAGAMSSCFLCRPYCSARRLRGLPGDAWPRCSVRLPQLSPSCKAVSSAAAMHWAQPYLSPWEWESPPLASACGEQAASPQPAKRTSNLFWPRFPTR